MNFSRLLFYAFSACFLFNGCTSSLKMQKASVTTNINSLQLLDVYELPSALQFKNTTTGGLSGIDYDPQRDLYYLICDDRSDINPSRFYTARIKFTDKGIDTVSFVDAITLLDKNKKPYSNLKDDPSRRIDPEGIRYNFKNDKLYWTNEGEKTTINGQLILCNPAVTIIGQNGQAIDSFLLPANMHVHSEDKGIRRNGAFEGLSFDNTCKFLYVSVEEPLYEDGPRAGLGDSTAWIRFIKFDVASKKPVAQYAYKIDAVPYPANPPGAFKINGVPEILYIGNNKLLVIERAFSTGRRPCSIRLYIADLSGATDISASNSLLTDRSFKPITKKLLLNMDELGRHIDNVEGLCFGPKLPNGNSSLILVSDDNFSPSQVTQFFLFEVK